MAAKHKRGLDRFLDKHIAERDEEKKTISKLKMEAISVEKEDAADQEERSALQGDRPGKKGAAVHLPKVSVSFGKFGDKNPLKSLGKRKEKIAGKGRSKRTDKWEGDHADEAEYVEDDDEKPDFFEKKDDVHMHPLPSLYRLTTTSPQQTIFIVALFTFLLLMQAISIDYEAWGEGRTGITSRLNIRGEMEVYLPASHESADILTDVREYWSTDLVIVYVEIKNPGINQVNITDRGVLHQMSYIEETLDPDKEDQGAVDGVLYCLSISTLIKEVNSTVPRVYSAVISNLGDLIYDYTSVDVPDETIINWTDETGLNDQVGTYNIPEDDQRINSTVRQLPQNVQDKVVTDTNGDGIWDKAVIIIGIDEERDPKKMIRAVDKAIEDSYKVAGIGQLVVLTNTGTVTLTDMITDQAFVYYAKLMPVAICLVTLAIMIFHRSLKAVFIAGTPTGCSIVWIYGWIGFLQVEVTPTVILLGPVILALGVSYGIHLANRIAQEPDPDPTVRAQTAIRTTGRAVFLSAATTVIGFSSLAYGDLKPVTTLGVALTVGIAMCYFLTMLLAPTIAIMVDYRKKTGEGAAKTWKRISEIPIKYNYPIIIGMVIMVLISVSMTPFIESDTDVLSMAPNDPDVDGVDKIIAITDYSENFNSGATGMVIVETEGYSKLRTNEYSNPQADPIRTLKQIDITETAINYIQVDPGLPVNAISVVSVMKSVGASAYVAVTDVPIFGQSLAEMLGVDPNLSQSTNFWDLLLSVDNLIMQKFLLNVFYDSLSEEALGMVINQYKNEDSPDYYSKTLIYVDMPVLTDKEVHEAVFSVDEITEEKSISSQGIEFTHLTGVAAIAVAINDGLISSQQVTLVLSILLVWIVLSFIFWDKNKKPHQNFGLGGVTTLPVVLTVALEPFFMVTLGVSLNLATVMIGSTVVGAGVDFSVHITQRSLEGGRMTRRSIMNAVEKSGMGLFEATTITILGLLSAILPYVGIPIPAIFEFVMLIMILLVIAAIAAMLVLPAILWTIVKNQEGAYD